MLVHYYCRHFCVLLALWYFCKTMFHCSAAPVCDPASGHAYDMIGSVSGYSNAAAMAQGSYFAGCQGYLLTITSAAESNFLYGQYGNVARIWTAGTRSGCCDYKWTMGPENGLFVSKGLSPSVSCKNYGYCPYASGEPNVNHGTENCLVIYTTGGWRDVDSSTGSAVVVEYGDNSCFPCVTPTSSTTPSSSTSFTRSPTSSISFSPSPSRSYSQSPTSSISRSPSSSSSATSSGSASPQQLYELISFQLSFYLCFFFLVFFLVSFKHPIYLGVFFQFSFLITYNLGFKLPFYLTFSNLFLFCFFLDDTYGL